MSWQINKQDIPFLAMGAKLLACGGGGHTHTIENLLMSIMKDEDVITVLSIADLADEWIVGTGMIGSTVLYNENLPSGHEGGQALRLYESVAQKKADALISVEIGGVNALAPLLAAIQNQLPVVDGDGMGRAFPELSMTTFYLNQILPAPFILQAHEANTVIQDVRDINITAEKAKDFIAANGGYAHFASFGANAKKMKTAMIPGSLQLIYRLGAVMKKEAPANEKINEMTAVFENSLYGKPIPIISGVVTDVNRWFKNQSLIGKFTVDGQSSFSNKTVEIEFKNEFIAITEKQYVCMPPDLILVLNEENLKPYSVTEIRTGLAVIVFAVPAPLILRTKDMLELVGPRNFEIAACYQPLQGVDQHEAGY